MSEVPSTEMDLYEGHDIDEYEEPSVEEPIDAWATDLPAEDAELVDEDDGLSLTDGVSPESYYGGGGGGGGSSRRRKGRGGGGGGGGGRGGFTLFAFDFLNNNSLAKTGDNSLIKTGNTTKRKGRRS